MKYYNVINMSSGHSKRVKGASHYIDEVTEAIKVVNRVQALVMERGGTCRIFHEDKATNKNDNLKNIVRWHNGFSDGIDVSVHFNAFEPTTSARGVEVLYGSPKEEASHLSAEVAKAGGFKNRGAKTGSHLYFIKNTKKKAMLIEVCFVDSKADVDLYHKNFEAICEAIAFAITGKSKPVQNKPVENKPVDKPVENKPSENKGEKFYRVIAGSYKDKANAEKMEAQLKKAGYDAFVDVYYK